MWYAVSKKLETLKYLWGTIKYDGTNYLPNSNSFRLKFLPNYLNKHWIKMGSA